MHYPHLMHYLTHPDESEPGLVTYPGNSGLGTTGKASTRLRLHGLP
jgi:hypothetical protein